MPSLFVGNLPYAATNHDLEALFLQHQFQPRTVRIILDRETNKSRGFGFVELASPDECARAKLLLDGGYFMDRPISLRDADSKPPRPGSGMPTGGPKPGRGFSPPGGPARPTAARFDDKPPKRDARRQARRDRERDRGDDW